MDGMWKIKTQDMFPLEVKDDYWKNSSQFWRINNSVVQTIVVGEDLFF